MGLAGVAFSWAYSASPFKLMSRSLGELTVALAWFGVVIDADCVQRRQFFVNPTSATAGFGLMVAALPVINCAPDVKADAQVGANAPWWCGWVWLGDFASSRNCIEV